MPRLSCPACGSFNEEHSVFCDQCGSSLRGDGGRRTSRSIGVVILLVLVAGLVGALLIGRSGGQTGQRGDTVQPATAPAGDVDEASVRTAGTTPDEVTSSPSEPTAVVAAEQPAEERVEEPNWTQIPTTESSRWAEVVTLGPDEHRRYACAGAVLEGGLLLCPVEALVNAESVQITWGSRRLTVASTVGWDLDRSFCLLRLAGESKGFVPARARPGDQVTAVSGQRRKSAVLLEDPAAYGLEAHPFYLARAGESGCFLLNEEGILGVSWYRWPGMPVGLFGRFEGATVGEEVPFAVWNERVWGESAYSFYCAGRDAFGKARFAEAADLLAEAYNRQPGLWRVVVEHLTDAYLKWAGELSAAGDLEDARAILLKALEVVSDSKEILLVLSREEATLGYLEDALHHARRALAQDAELFAKRWRILEDRYLALAATLATSPAVKLLVEGADEVPDSVNIRVELGTLLFKDRHFADAIALWEEAYALSRDPEIAKLLEEARRIAAAEDEVVVIPIPDSSSTIRAPVIFGGALEVPCIVDTGATFTAMPRWAAQELGVDIRSGKQVRIATASGIENVPLVSIASVRLGERLEIGPIEVLILDLPHPAERQSPGLLGLNFLRNFNVSINRERKELPDLSAVDACVLPLAAYFPPSPLGGTVRVADDELRPPREFRLDLTPFDPWLGLIKPFRGFPVDRWVLVPRGEPTDARGVVRLR